MNTTKIPNRVGEKFIFSFQQETSTSFFIKSKRFVFLIALIFTFLPKQGWGQCSNSLSCNGGVNISVDENCTFTIHPSQFISNYSSLPQICKDSFRVYVTDENDNFIADDVSLSINLNTTTLDIEINDSLYITVYKDIEEDETFDGNEPNCWSGAIVEDKLAPVFENCSDTTIYCFEELANVANGPIFSIEATDNCGNANDVTISLLDSTLNLIDCATDPTTKATLVKRWIASDLQGNMDTCTQTITVLRIPTTGVTITPPANVDLECNLSNSPDTTLAALGYPNYSFVDINGATVNIELNPGNISGLCSDIKLLYEDSPNLGGMCGNGEKYIRTFSVYDCCADVFLDTVIQAIEITDSLAPILTCPSDITVGTLSNSCFANVTLPAVGITDACSTTNFDVSVITPVGTINTNGGTISNVPVGAYTITYVVNDECNNESMCTMNLTVEDDLAPIPVCDENTVIALNNLGTASANAMVFDDGSTDNCGIVTYEVRRMLSNCSAETPFMSSVDFACCDIGEVIMVELRLTDAAGNTNTCMVDVQVQDTQTPTIFCPPNITIECGADTSVVALGMAIGSDNCGTASVTWVNTGTLSSCGIGLLSRIWTVTDAQGLTTSCIQEIEVTNTDPFSGDTDPNDVDDILFPADFLGTNSISCSAYQNDPTLTDPINTGEPVLVGNILGCNMTGTIIPTDLVLNMGSGDCNAIKIFRKWVVVDWCQAGNDPDLTQDGPGVWVHTQVIMVADNEDPILNNPPSDITVSADADCQGTVTIPSIAQGDIDDCSSNVSVSVTSTNLGGNGFGPFTVDLGSYTATYLLNDGCGNTSTHTINITVEDDKMPTPVCQGISTQLMPTGMLMLPVMTFVNSSSSDNCTAFDDLVFTVVFDSLNDPNAPPTATEILFTCDDLGLSDVALWACDAAGNCDFCVIEVMMTAAPGTCGNNPGPTAMATGLIDNEQGFGIDEVDVRINNGQYIGMTNSNGIFNVEDLPMYENYNVKPEKNNSPLNGVTTYDIALLRKHILGMELLDSPYKIIAGDVNGSGEVTALDLAQIRNLILYNTSEFPNGMPSWRFVDANYVFPNPSNPLGDPFPETVDILNLSSNMIDLDFVAIKTGDVNDNASPNLLVSDTRTKEGDLIFKTKNETIKKGEEFSIVFETDNAKDFLAWQFTLSFEEEMMQYLEVEKIEDIHFGTSVLEKGAITFSWDNREEAILKTKLNWFSVRFRATRKLEIKDVISVTSKHTTAVAYNSDGNEYYVELEFDNKVEDEIGEEFKLYQNTPNPFAQSTSINFYLPEEDNIEITVYDMTGKLLKTFNSFYPKGVQSFVLQKEDIFSSGLLYYHVKTSKHQASGKMILLP